MIQKVQIIILKIIYLIAPISASFACSLFSNPFVNCGNTKKFLQKKAFLTH